MTHLTCEVLCLHDTDPGFRWLTFNPHSHTTVSLGNRQPFGQWNQWRDRCLTWCTSLNSVAGWVQMTQPMPECWAPIPSKGKQRIGASILYETVYLPGNSCNKSTNIPEDRKLPREFLTGWWTGRFPGSDGQPREVLNVPIVSTIFSQWNKGCWTCTIAHEPVGQTMSNVRSQHTPSHTGSIFRRVRCILPTHI